MEGLKACLRKIPFRTHILISVIIFLVGAVLMLVGTSSGEDYLWTFVTGIILMVLTAVYSIIVFRCPYCDAMLNTRGSFPTYCPHCGKELPK